MGRFAPRRTYDAAPVTESGPPARTSGRSKRWRRRHTDAPGRARRPREASQHMSVWATKRPILGRTSPMSSLSSPRSSHCAGSSLRTARHHRLLHRRHPAAHRFAWGAGLPAATLAELTGLPHYRTLNRAARAQQASRRRRRAARHRPRRARRHRRPHRGAAVTTLRTTLARLARPTPSIRSTRPGPRAY